MSYVWAGYGVTLVTLAGYAAWVLRRSRRLGAGASTAQARARR